MLTVGSLFSGVGLLDYGLELAGLRHEWFCESDEWRRGILAQRWPGVRVADDVRSVGRDFPRVDVIAGGFPCKGASTAGKREGFGHPETVLWREMFRAVRELEPRFVVVENVANLLALHDGAVWGEVVGDLASLGFDIEWDCLPAGAVGAPHLRDRVFAVAAHAESAGGQGARPGREALVGTGADGDGAAADADSERESGLQCGARTELAITGVDRRVAADAGGVRWERRAGQQGEGRSPTVGREEVDPAGNSHPSPARGVAVEWGEYEPAIRRWEAVHGRAPEPLVRRVDDRSTARVERSRLSALGDGVQVQIGQLVGEYLMGLAGECAA